MFVKKIYESVLKKKLDNINNHLYSIKFRDPEINEMYKYSIATGKRIRPLLVLLSCEAVGSRSNKFVPIAASFELLHKASLIHDDVIDEDKFRRGVPSFYNKYSMEKAVVMGDLLVSVAFTNLYRHRELLGNRFYWCNRKFIDAFRQISMGELSEEILRSSIRINSASIEDLHYKKTASLFEAGFEIGAICGGGTVTEQKNLARFGQIIGMIYQTINDINNIDGLESKIRKNAYSDLKKSKKNHLVLHSMKNGSQKDKQILKSIMMKPHISGSDIEQLLEIFRRNKSMQHVYRKIDAYIHEAETCVRNLRPSAAKAMFSMLTKEAKNKWIWK